VRCASTNDLALERLASGCDHGTLVLAEEQTRGRGQRGRAWHSPAGLSVYASLVLRSPGPIRTPTLVVAAVGLGIAEGLETATGLDVGLKWPNDLWIGGRKLGGVLVESRGYRADQPGLVAGFGLNVNHGAGDFPPELRAVATSVAQRIGARVDRFELLADVLYHLELRLDQALGGGSTADLHHAYRERSVLTGERVRLTEVDTPVVGVVADLSATDGLLLRLDDGSHRHVRAEHARDVRIE
jgi:BirA family biotin operon repressor/biotin-[acetyl-CoA-carboxylase] ligase